MTPKKVNKAKYFRMQRWTAIGFALFIILLAIPGRVFAGPPSPLDPGSDGAAEIKSLFYLVLAIAVVVFVLVEGLLLYAVFRYRRRPDDDTQPEQIHGNATLEIMWTVVPAAIMVVLFVLTLRTLQAQQSPPEDAYTVQVIGHQWFWEFRYPETEVITIDYLAIPGDRPIRFEVSSVDVIHSFWVPQLAGKLDAIPGRTNVTWLEANWDATKAATYRDEYSGITYPGECAEFCGREHYAMLFDVVVMEDAEFARWMDDRIEEMGAVVCEEAPCAVEEIPEIETLPAGTAAEGRTLFEGKGNCISCHSLDGSVLVGPTFQGISGRAEGRSAEESAQQYLGHSILRPCDLVVPGFTCVMPTNYGQLLNADELADLIAFLMEQ